MKKEFIKRVLTILLAFALLIGNPLPVFADETSVPKVAITVTQGESEVGEDGDRALVSVELITEEGASADGYKINKAFILDGKESTISSDYKDNLKAGKTYEFYAFLTDGEGNRVSESEHVTINVVGQEQPTVEKTPSSAEAPTGTITVTNGSSHIYYTSPLQTVEGNVIEGLANGKYYVSFAAYSEGDTFYLKSRSTAVNIDNKAVYSVSYRGDDFIAFSKTKDQVEEGDDLTFYIKTNDDGHYIDPENITITPAENFEDHSFYASTGELIIHNITGNITVSAEATEKPVASVITVLPALFNEDGIYSEENPSIQTELRVLVTDDEGNAVPDTTVYLKADKSEVSYITRTTDNDGYASYKYSYSVSSETGDTTADYVPVFALDPSFEKAYVESEIHLILQKKADLVLYTDQITGSRPEEHEGKVTDVPDDYELYDGEVHEYAIVIGSGKWISPVDGEFTGLSSGVHIIRFGEKRDEETNTFWFASDHDYFEIPRLISAPAEEQIEEPTVVEDTTTVASSPASTPAPEDDTDDEEDDASEEPAAPAAPAAAPATGILAAPAGGTVAAPAAEPEAEPEPEAVPEPEAEPEPEAAAPEESAAVTEPEVTAAAPSVNRTIEEEATALAATAPVNEENGFNYILLILVLALAAAGAGAYYVIRKQRIAQNTEE